MENNDKNSSIKVSDTIFLGIITALGYYVAYSYQLGYVSFFKLPKIFINDIGIVKILIAVTSFSSIIILILSLHNVTKNFYPSSNHPVSISIRRLYWFVLVIIGFSLYSASIEMALLLGFILLLLIINEFVFPLFSFRKTKGYINKLRMAQEHESKEGLIPKVKQATEDKLKLYVMVALIFFVTSAVARMIGITVSSNELEHLIIKDNNITYVVIDSYNDKFIVAPVNLSNKSVLPQYKLFDQQSYTYELVNTGKLQVEKATKIP